MYVDSDVLLAKRLPDVELLTPGGPGVPTLAVCYARSRDLPLVAIPIDHEKHHGNTIEQRGTRLVELADAVELVGDATEVCDLIGRAMAKGLRVVVVGSVLSPDVGASTGVATIVSTGPDAGTYLTGKAVVDHAIAHVAVTGTQENLALLTQSAASGIAYHAPLTGVVGTGGFGLTVINGGITIDGIGTPK